jgi:hypothetical protein
VDRYAIDMLRAFAIPEGEETNDVERTSDHRGAKPTNEAP